MSDAKKKADAIRASYLSLNDGTDEHVETLEDVDDYCGSYGLNMKRYSQDGHSWNGRPMICVDMRKY